MNYTTLAMTTCVIAAGSSEAAKLADKKPMTMRPVVGAFVLGIFLFAFGMMQEDLARKFCYLVIATALLTNGVKLFTILK
jgi:hypothetical protein